MPPLQDLRIHPLNHMEPAIGKEIEIEKPISSDRLNHSVLSMLYEVLENIRGGTNTAYMKPSLYQQKNDSGVDFNFELPNAPQQQESEPKIIILQSEKAVFKSSNQLIGHWNQLVDTEEAWSSNSQMLTSASMNENNTWSPMYVWAPNNRSNYSRNNNIVSQHWNQLKMNKKAYYKCIGLLLVICIGLSVGLGIFMHIKLANRHYDSTTGPRGSAPGVSTASPLPIFNVTDSNSTLVYLGVTLDWSKDDPEHFNIDLGRTTSIQDVVFFMNDTFSNVGFANSSGYIHKEDNLIQWTAALIRGTGAIMGITIIPKIRMGLINSTAFLDIAEKCKMVNQMGIPVLLRFGPEMNGFNY